MKKGKFFEPEYPEIDEQLKKVDKNNFIHFN